MKKLGSKGVFFNTSQHLKVMCQLAELTLLLLNRMLWPAYSLFQFSSRTLSNFESECVRNYLFHLSSFDQNPLLSVKSLYVGQWIVISILKQL